MHDMDQCYLTWDDQTQWALNRLSASQVAMANANVITTQGHHKKYASTLMKGLVHLIAIMGTLNMCVVIVLDLVRTLYIRNLSVTVNRGG